MRNTKVIFSCIEIGDQPFNYELYEDNDTFRVLRDGFPPTKSKMRLLEAIEYIVSDIRNLKAVKYFEIKTNLSLQILTLIGEGSEIKLPDIYKVSIEKIRQKIVTGTVDFKVYGREDDNFLSNNNIYFDNIFKQDIQELKMKLNKSENL